MPWETPSLEQITERSRADLRARLPGARPELRRSLLRALADMHAGGVQGLYGYLDWQAEQILPDTAEAEILERWADVWGVPRAAAGRATGMVVFTGNDGVTIPSEARLEASDGAEYETDDSVEITGGEAEVEVTAVDAGEAGNQNADTDLTLVSAIAGVDSTATVGPDGLTGGADDESDTRLRQRLLQRIQRPPHGGATGDYEAWALEAHPDVTRVWPVPNALGRGTVTVRLMTDDATEDGTPEQSVLDTVYDYIQERRPVGAELHVVSPVAVALDLTIGITPDTQDVRDRIEEAIADYLQREAKPGGTLYHSDLNGVIYVASGDSRHELESPTEDPDYADNEIAVLGTITWN